MGDAELEVLAGSVSESAANASTSASAVGSSVPKMSTLVWWNSRNRPCWTAS
jgi:hypothetical protein